MSVIKYSQAAYAGRLRADLEQAGCQPKVAAAIERSVGDLIDFVVAEDDELRRETDARESTDRLHRSQIDRAKEDGFCKAIGVTVLVMTVALIASLLIAALGHCPMPI